ncbi:SdpI family protein [Rhodococcus xishaensis]|uniref:SdpI family protein n=1 Tax=Rhodococcus xishaensis TaxID=2487364 RepID=A0A3S3DZV9_9NOCA|nr:SdpI family protein [Rhodococcus xishaensis]RVW02030.1 SdpI family protein [Rhodococcus xishaensis]
MLIVAVVLFFAAVGLAALGIAGLTGRLSRNRWAGVRTPESLRDDEAFALANKVAAPTILASAVVLGIGGVAATLLDGILPIFAVSVSVVAALLTAAVGGTLGSRAAGALPEETSGCGTSCGACSLQGACEPA